MQSASDAPKTSSKRAIQKAADATGGLDAPKMSSKRAIQKAADAAGGLISNKNANRITKVSKYLSQNNSETVTNEHVEEIPNEIYISQEERKIIDDMRLI